MQVRDEAVGVGYVQAKVPVSASAKINGVIRKVYVDQGDRVAKGQVLAQLENEDYYSQIAQADSQLQATQAGVSSARAELLAAQATNQKVACSSHAGRTIRFKHLKITTASNGLF